MPDNGPPSLRVERIPAGYGILVGAMLNVTGWHYILLIFNQTSVLPGMAEYVFAPIGVLGGLLLIALSIRNSNGVGLAGLYVAFPGWILYIVVVVERMG